MTSLNIWSWIPISASSTITWWPSPWLMLILKNTSWCFLMMRSCIWNALWSTRCRDFMTISSPIWKPVIPSCWAIPVRNCSSWVRISDSFGSGARRESLTGICWLRRSTVSFRIMCGPCFIFTRKIKPSTIPTRGTRVSSGSMPMIIPEVFSALCVILRMARTICSLSSTLHPWLVRITG